MNLYKFDCGIINLEGSQMLIRRLADCAFKPVFAECSPKITQFNKGSRNFINFVSQ